MDNKIKIMIFLNIMLLSLTSCGWFESENTIKIKFNNYCDIYYDENNVAFDDISIIKNDGSNMVNNCNEVYNFNNYIYIKKTDKIKNKFSFIKYDSKLNNPFTIDSITYFKNKRQIKKDSIFNLKNIKN